MRILITYPADRLTGAARYAAAMAVEMRRRGHDVAVAMPGGGPALAEFTADAQHAPRIMAVELPNLRRNPRDALRHAAGLVRGTFEIGKILDHFKPDVVIAHCIFNMWTAVAAAAKRMPLVCVIHELPAAFPAALYWGWQLVLAHTARHLVLVSNGSRQHLPPHKVTVIPPGINTRIFHPEVNGSNLRSAWLAGREGPLLVCVSHIMPAKGQLDLLEALALVKAWLPNVRLALVGSTNAIAANEAFLQRLRARTRELGINSMVVFVESPVSAASALAASDLVVYPSHNESFGLVPLEANAIGRRVVATSVGIAPQLAASGGAVTLAPPRHPGLLAKAILATLAQGPTSAFTRREWTIEGAVDAFESLLQRL